MKKIEMITCIMYVAVSSSNQVKKSISWTRDLKNQVQMDKKFVSWKAVEALGTI